MIPDDPEMLLSYLNMKLRDGYDSLSALCDDLELPEEELAEKLRRAGYVYDKKTNAFTRI